VKFGKTKQSIMKWKNTPAWFTITVGAKMNLFGLIQAHVEVVKEKAENDPGANAATSGRYANAATSGRCANTATTGGYANAATSGRYANAATIGDYALFAGGHSGEKSDTAYDSVEVYTA
jgi:hypothetical protein